MKRINAYNAVTSGKHENGVKSSVGGRVYSLDLLRIISMLMIVFLHINSHGGLNGYWSLYTANGILLRLIQVCSMVAVNVYVLISGYFQVYQKFRISRTIRIVLETTFYSWLIGVILIIKGCSFSIRDYLSLFLPVSYTSYWFVTAYIGLSLLSPFINGLLASLNRKQHLLLSALLLCMHCVLRDILVNSNPFATANGYTLVWFITLYVVAAYIRKYVKMDSIRHPFAIYLGTCLLMFASWALFTVASEKFSFIERYGLCSYWTRYNSILNTSSSIFLFITFAKMTIKSTMAIRAIGCVAPLTLGVYLIHDNSYVRNLLWFDILHADTFENNAFLIPRTILVVIAVFTVCIAVDFLRKIFFDALFYRRKYFTELMNKLDNLPYRIMDKIPY